MPPSSLWQRRELLQHLVLMAAGLLGLPRQAFALGGVLPQLDQPAPAFSLDGIQPRAGADPEPARLGAADFAGRWLGGYFYPRDFTSGCTREARGFQRDLDAFHQRRAEVVGISADGADSHERFCGSEGLTYPLLSDTGGAVSRSYGSWLAPFSLRHTFLIDPEGVLRARWTAVRPAGHSREILAELDRLQAPPLP